MIEFRTLGTLDLRRTDGPELNSLLAQPKRIALLAYLCLATPHGLFATLVVHPLASESF